VAVKAGVRQLAAGLDAHIPHPDALVLEQLHRADVRRGVCGAVAAPAALVELPAHPASDALDLLHVGGGCEVRGEGAHAAAWAHQRVAQAHSWVGSSREQARSRVAGLSPT